jgi:hypothetical protein
MVSRVTKLVGTFSQECTGNDAANFGIYADFVGDSTASKLLPVPVALSRCIIFVAIAKVNG